MSRSTNSLCLRLRRGDPCETMSTNQQMSRRQGCGERRKFWVGRGGGGVIPGHGVVGQSLRSKRDFLTHTPDYNRLLLSSHSKDPREVPFQEE